MKKIGVFVVFYCMIISSSQFSDDNNDRSLSKTLNKLASLHLPRVKRSKTIDYVPTRMYYPDEILPNGKYESKNCSYGFCEDVPSYPSDKIRRIIGQSKEFRNYFVNQSPQIDFASRFGENGENLCTTTLQTVFPKTARNVQGEDQLLVNIDQYKQGVTFEVCANTGGACKYSEVFPDGITTTCQQKYSVIRLLAIGKENDQPIFDRFQLPSCCICTYKKN